MMRQPRFKNRIRSLSDPGGKNELAIRHVGHTLAVRGALFDVMMK